MGEMKLIFAIVQDEDVDGLIEGLRAAQIGATKIGSSGGFLRRGNTTLLIGVADEQVAAVFDLVERHCRRRLQRVAPYVPGVTPELVYPPEAAEVEVGGAIVFVQPVERFRRV